MSGSLQYGNHYTTSYMHATLLFTTIVTRFFDEIKIYISPDAFFHDLHDSANIFEIW